MRDEIFKLFNAAGIQHGQNEILFERLQEILGKQVKTPCMNQDVPARNEAFLRLFAIVKNTNKYGFARSHRDRGMTCLHINDVGLFRCVLDENCKTEQIEFVQDRGLMAGVFTRNQEVIDSFLELLHLVDTRTIVELVERLEPSAAIEKVYNDATKLLGEHGYKQTEVRRDQNGIKIFVDTKKTRYFSFQIREKEYEYRAVLKREVKSTYGFAFPPAPVSYHEMQKLIKTANRNALMFLLYGECKF